MKLRRSWILILVIAFMSLGMGSMGAGAGGKVKRPKHNFRATITDVSSVQTHVEYAACGGHTRLEGNNGKSEVSIPFERVERVVISDKDERYKTATVNFWDGRTFQVDIKAYLACTGVTEMGDVTVKVRYLRQIDFERGEYTDDGSKDESDGKPSS
ncbi:MAG: hypothetical protein H6684_10905 [Deltaproteobacteria bacterium]|nr:hypothetical protein [bacterium]MCB9477987.1 hypothetical protein [Deltaproteobacteria bacterium]MCB9489230.1 hypothetical protein [Deltaproteobacteria bacterium]